MPRQSINPISFVSNLISIKNSTGNKVIVAIRSCQNVIEIGVSFLIEALFNRVRIANENAERMPHKSPNNCVSEMALIGKAIPIPTIANKEYNKYLGRIDFFNKTYSMKRIKHGNEA